MALKCHLKGEFSQTSLRLLVILSFNLSFMVANFSEVQFLCSKKEKENIVVALCLLPPQNMRVVIFLS